MGLLERMGLVEKIEDDVRTTNPEDSYDTYEEELPEVNTEGVSQENLITDIYNANGLFDMSNSIFKAEEISKTLPATMTTEAKKATVIGILGSFNLTVEGLKADAEERIGTLNAVLVNITKNATDVIDSKKQEIEEAKRHIEQCEKEIAANEKIIADSTDTIEAEIKRITGLDEFLGGTK